MDLAPNILIFSASDPTCGAGMQADIQTVSSLGCHPLSALTGLTVQDTKGVYHLNPVDEKLLEAQAQTILDDSKVELIKCGMLSSEENIHVLAKLLNEYPNIKEALISAAINEKESVAAIDMALQIASLSRRFSEQLLHSQKAYLALVDSKLTEKTKTALNASHLQLYTFQLNCFVTFSFYVNHPPETT